MKAAAIVAAFVAVLLSVQCYNLSARVAELEATNAKAERTAEEIRERVALAVVAYELDQMGK